MKKSNKLVARSLLMAVLCAGTSVAMAQSPTPGQNQTGNSTQQRDNNYTGQARSGEDNQNVGTNPNQNRNTTGTQTDQYRQSQSGQQNNQPQTSDAYRHSTTHSTINSSATYMGSGVVTKANKASSLIGMDVKNQNGENLGEIKDIVFSLDQDKVAYAVLQTGMGVIGTGKLHAVPLRAFRTSADNDHLILNADKDKLARAAGFEKDNWPSMNTSSWGAEPFWQDTTHMKGTEGSHYNQGTTGTQGTRGDGSRRDTPSTGTSGTTR